MDIYRIVDRDTDKEVGVYMPPTARDEYNFSSIEEARESNCHGIYEDKTKYKIRKYKLVLVDDDCDPPTAEEFARAKQEEERKEALRELAKKYSNEIAFERHGVLYDELEFASRLPIYAEASLRVVCEELNNGEILK